MQTIYMFANSWSDISQPYDLDLHVMEWKSTWPVFHHQVILPYFSMTIWWMNIVLGDYESSVMFLLPSKCRSWWPKFHGPVILSFWWFNIILWVNESVRPDLWPQYESRSQWPIYHSLVILPYILKTVWWMNVILWDNELMWCTLWPRNKCSLDDLYFTIQWFCLVSWRLCDQGGRWSGKSQGNLIFLQGQGKDREFANWSGKF